MYLRIKQKKLRLVGYVMAKEKKNLCRRTLRIVPANAMEQGIYSSRIARKGLRNKIGALEVTN